MSLVNPWSSLFLKSSFFAIKKADDLSPEFRDIQKKIIINEAIENAHAKRKEEFLLGRLCAFKAYESCTGKTLLSLPVNIDRSPDWPLEVVGSLSHNKEWVGAAVAKKRDLLGVGIDFEVIGRVKSDLAKQIRSENDLQSFQGLSEEELLTLIFSCKESLYKALYPTVKKFFGFNDAAVTALDLNKGIFEIDLLKDLSKVFGPEERHLFQGRIMINEGTCLSVLEIGLL